MTFVFVTSCDSKIMHCQITYSLAAFSSKLESNLNFALFHSGVHGGSADRGVHVRRHDAHPLVALHGPQPQGAHPQVHPRHATGEHEILATIIQCCHKIGLQRFRESESPGADCFPKRNQSLTPGLALQCKGGCMI